MSEAAASTRREFEAQIVARAWADEGFRERLKTDPRGAVRELTGISVPDSVEIEVLEKTPEKGYLVFPLNRVAISEDELDAVAGGPALEGRSVTDEDSRALTTLRGSESGRSGRRGNTSGATLTRTLSGVEAF
jgi:nitrile hydratase alpha subunit